jgi:hypothetical protein
VLGLLFVHLAMQQLTKAEKKIEVMMTESLGRDDGWIARIAKVWTEESRRLIISRASAIF